MTKPTIALLLAGLFAATGAVAGHEEHGTEAQDKPVAARDACARDGVPLADRMLENIRVQMDAIRDTEDPEERQRLLRNHLQSMLEVLDLMERPEAHAGHEAAPAPDAQSGESSGHGKKMQKMMDGKRGMKHGGMAMHRELEERVNRLQKLIEQMIEHEQAEQDDAG